MLSIASYHIKEAFLEDDIFVQKLPVKDLSSRFEHGVTIANPPYGERIGEKEEIEKLYIEMGKAYNNLDTWSHYIFTASKEFEKLFGKKADRKRKLYNGRIECTYYQYYGPRPAKQTKE